VPDRVHLIARAAVVAVTFVLVLTALGFRHFRSSATRLTDVPPSLAQAVLSRVPGLPKTPRSVIVIVEENQSYEKILDDPDSASYIASLAKEGALFTRSYGVGHPSQPNYFALFAGRVNLDGDSCPATTMPADAPNLGAELLTAHRTFRAYVEDLPSPGYPGCASGEYARKHAPWTQFANVPARDAVPFSYLRSYDALPDVAFIIPNLVHDMHSASVADGDAWLRQNVDPLVAWAKRHDALVILTWDESESLVTNHIPTIFVGPMVRPGRYAEVVTHYRVLRTIEDLFGLPHAGHAAEAAPITNVWR
jgi:acid phosphatase